MIRRLLGRKRPQRTAPESVLEISCNRELTPVTAEASITAADGWWTYTIKAADYTLPDGHFFGGKRKGRPEKQPDVAVLDPPRGLSALHLFFAWQSYPAGGPVGARPGDWWVFNIGALPLWNEREETALMHPGYSTRKRCGKTRTGLGDYAYHETQEPFQIRELIEVELLYKMAGLKIRMTPQPL